jgi:hypothetical protein
LCGLIREVPIIVASRAVDKLADDVGMPRVPSDFYSDMHHDLLQGDLLPLRRPPPPNSARRIEGERVDGGVCVDCCPLISATMSSRDSSAVAHMSALVSASGPNHMVSDYSLITTARRLCA